MYETFSKLSIDIEIDKKTRKEIDKKRHRDYIDFNYILEAFSLIYCKKS